MIQPPQLTPPHPPPGKSTIKQYFVATSKSVVYHTNKCFLSLLEENGQILTHLVRGEAVWSLSTMSGYKQRRDA